MGCNLRQVCICQANLHRRLLQAGMGCSKAWDLKRGIKSLNVVQLYITYLPPLGLYFQYVFSHAQFGNEP